MSAKYPLEPLAVALGCSLAQLGRRLNVSGSTWKQYRDEGVTERVADRLAVKVGKVAYEVWPDMLDRAVAEAVERRRAQWRASKRRQHQDPAYRAARAEYMRRYRVEARAVLNAQKRQWRAAHVEQTRQSAREAMRRYRARQKAA